MKAFRVEEVLLSENKEGLKGIKADRCAVNLDIQFDTSFEPQELNHELNHDLKPFSLSAYDHVNLVANKLRTSWLLVSILVISCHLALVFTLNILWTSAPLLYSQAKHDGTKSEVPLLKGPQLKAYMYYQAPAIEKSRSELIDNLGLEPKLTAADLTESDVSQVLLKPKSKQDSFVEDPVVIEAKQSLAEPEDFSKSKNASSMSQSSYFFSPEQENNDGSDRLNISNFSASTQKYLSRQREAALGELFVAQANQYTRTKTLSEMDGEMIILELPKVDILSDTETLGDGLDPNRIVKKGDTCYRIVKTPTPINPHAENLGYPFRCDGDSVAAALTRAIAKRVHKRPIKS
ncbi:hypothetical protein MK852_13215 [Shewanella benthica]|uniref:hypothetical protein n=1 Tax=Shewanella benthica TaxID=43661 RepID=UPI00187ABD30|nr:hypothetical protein [Shewanella benthica]MBE7216175.1 hypothetical protein [Shewanella benthica]MCL1063084.1 hypothetical protein [Shewanella benthica]